MKNIPYILAATLAFGASAQIVIKPVRTPSGTPKRPGITVPGPEGGARPVAQKPQVIELLNGDTLRGSFVGYDSKGGAKWRHPAAKSEILFDPDSVSKILLHPRPEPVSDRQNCGITLRTGEQLRGELVELNDKYLIMNAWYSRNRLRIPRDKIQSISPGGKAADLIYQGPANTDGWVGANGQVGQMELKQRIQINGRIRGGLVPPGFPGVPGGGGFDPGGRAGWTFSKNAFSTAKSGAQIGRKVKFADRTNFEFDLSWQGRSFNISIHFCSDKMSQYGGNGYIIGLRQYNCHLIRSHSRNGHGNIGNANLPAQFRGKAKARISIRVDRKNSTITLLMDNQLIRTWIDSAGFNGKGDVLMFLSQSSSRVKVSNIRITKWDGSLPAAGGVTRKVANDLLRSKDSDISGTLLGITNGKAQFKASFNSKLDMPLEDIITLRLAGDEKEKTKLGLGDVKVTLASGGDFTFRLESWTVDRVTGVSPIFGRVDFRPSAFAAVEFNLNKKRTDDDDDPFDF